MWGAIAAKELAVCLWGGVGVQGRWGLRVWERENVFEWWWYCDVVQVPTWLHISCIGCCRSTRLEVCLMSFRERRHCRRCLGGRRGQDWCHPFSRYLYSVEL